MVMLKDNHIDYAGSIEGAITRALEYQEKMGLNIPIEVETRNIDEVREVMRVGGIHRIMLDNMTPEEMRECVELIDGKYETEGSGNINIDSIRAKAESGVDFLSPYSVTVKSQPTAPSETCSVTNGSGVMGDSAITNVSVTCTVNAFTVGGDLAGLAAGESIELLLNGAHHTTLNTDGSFQFLPIADATPYSVTVAQQPSGQTCTVSNGTGVLAGSDVTNVAVSCVLNSYTIGGNLSGLASGKSLVLANNGGDDLTLL